MLVLLAILIMRHLAIILCLALTSCSGMIGTIERRDKGCDESLTDSKKIYLVNTSTSTKYQFTVKSIGTINDTIKSYGTNLFVLEPGDEKYLGCDKWLGEIKYPKKEARGKNGFPTVKMVFPDKSVGDIKIEDYKSALNAGAKLSSKLVWGGDNIGLLFTYDTIINGQNEVWINYQIIDSMNPLQRDRYKVEYKVTGQKEFKEKQKNKE